MPLNKRRPDDDGSTDAEAQEEFPESWEEVSLKDCPDPDYDRRPMRDPEELTEVPAEDTQS